MATLAIDTTTEKVRVGLGWGEAGGDATAKGGVAGEGFDFGEEEAARQHSEKLLELVERMMAGRGLSLGDVAEVVVIAGPGSYTSLRVGVTTANVLAYALGVPLSGVNWFEVKAGRVLDEGEIAAAGKASLPSFRPEREEMAGEEVMRRAIEIGREKIVKEREALKKGTAEGGKAELAEKFGFVAPYYLREPDITEKKRYC